MLNYASLINVSSDCLQVKKQLAPNVPTLYDLSNLNYFEVLGDKAQDFLQGQLTADVQKVTLDFAELGGLCDLKGRLLATMYITFCKQNFGLLVRRDDVNFLKKELALAAQFSRVKLNLLAENKFYGLYLPEDKLKATSIQLPQKSLEVMNNIIKLAHNFYLLLAPNNFNLLDFPVLSSTDWDKLLLANGNINIYPESRALFLPQELQLDKTDFISLTKGCYRGQEIIARMHYLGKCKYELVLTKLNSPTNILPGMQLYTESKAKVIGTVVDAALIHNFYIVLACVNKEYKEDALAGFILPVTE